MMQSMTAALCAARDPQSPTKPDPAKLSRTFFCARQEKSWEKKWVACFPRHTKLCAANGLPFFYLVAHTQHYIVSSRMEDGRKAKDDSFFPFSFIHFCRQRLSKWPFDTVNQNQGNSLILLFLLSTADFCQNSPHSTANFWFWILLNSYEIILDFDTLCYFFSFRSFWLLKYEWACEQTSFFSVVIMCINDIIPPYILLLLLLSNENIRRLFQNSHNLKIPKRSAARFVVLQFHPPLKAILSSYLPNSKLIEFLHSNPSFWP